MKGLVLLATALSGLSLAAGTYQLRVPYRVFEPLGSTVASAVTMPNSSEAYVFDGNTLSQQELLDALNAGTRIADTAFIAKVTFEDDGCIYTATFKYSGEPACTVWPLYIACVWGDGIESVFISPVAQATEMALKHLVMPVNLGDTEELSKNKPTFSREWHDPAVASATDPAVWYLVHAGGELLTLRPWKIGGAADKTEVPSDLVEGITDFSEFVRLESPEPTAISDADYRKYFFVNAIAKPGPSGLTMIYFGATLDESKVQLEKSAASFAAGFSSFAAGETEGVTFDTLPGLYYTVRFGSRPDSLELPAEPGFRKLAVGSSTELPLPRPQAAEGEPDAAFYRLVISAEEGAK